MKIITVMETAYTPRDIYSKANTDKTRALVGYMMRNGDMDNTILGGALHLLEEIEKASKANSVFRLQIETPYGDRIVAIVEMVRSGKFDRFKVSKADIYKNKHLLSKFLK